MSHRDDWSLLAQLDDAELERRLLASAADDAPPAAASERAFRALAADARALAGLAALAPVPSGEPALLPSAEPSPAASPAGVLRPPARALLAGLLLGAVAGAGAVGLWLRAFDAVRSSELEPPPLPPRPAAPLVVPALWPEPASPPPAVEVASTAAARAQRRAESPAASAADRASRLAREVALLDAARASLAIGANQSTLRQIERYRAEFPRGELAADAEAVAIEALAAEGDHAALAAAARRFLTRHPRDPHAARVRELAFIAPPVVAPPGAAPPVVAPPAIESSAPPVER